MTRASLIARLISSRAIVLGLVGALLTSFIVVNAVSSTSLGSNSVKLAVNTFANDTDITVANNSVIFNSSAASASGDSAPGVEASNALPAVNNALVLDNYAYTVEIKESGVTAWQSGEDLRIRVYGYSSSPPGVTLFATLYSRQAVVDDVTVEGVTATVDLGTTTADYDHIDIIIDRQ